MCTETTVVNPLSIFNLFKNVYIHIYTGYYLSLCCYLTCILLHCILTLNLQLQRAGVGVCLYVGVRMCVCM